MREIKFKAWDNINNEIVEIDGWNLYVADGKVYEIEERSQYYQVYMYKKDVSDRYKLMQYTGFNDKNGKEIYDGYIIRRKWFRGKEIKYVKEVIQFDIGAFWCGGELLGRHLTTVTPSEIEIIGNIYENKDLMEEE